MASLFSLVTSPNYVWLRFYGKGCATKVSIVFVGFVLGRKDNSEAAVGLKLAGKM